MIITNLIGGLGNQMFQYAAGRAVSLKKNNSLKLSVLDFAKYELHHGFELQRIFNCITDIASEEDVRNILGWQYSPRFRRILSRPSMSIIRRETFIVEPHFHYWSEIKNVPSNCFLSGYWQSDKYFADIEMQIRKDFTFKLPFKNKNYELAKQMSQVNAVSLHVRRGDYVNNLKTKSKHGLCSVDFYFSAIQYIAERVENPNFYIFSDDIPWVKSNLKIDFFHKYVDNNQGVESYNDMRLMSLCKHNIIANSSFSWWGAWLNLNLDKVVVAPKCWFANPNDVSDLLPQSWVKL
jgi:hypothetical protein